MLKSVDRVAQLIEAVGSDPAEVNELALRFGIHRTTMLRILQTLEDRQFVRRRQDGRYALGYRLLGLAHGGFDEVELRKAAYIPLRQVQHVTGHTVHLAVLEGNEVLFIDKAESMEGVGLYARIGQPLPAYCTAVGKAILSKLPEERVHEILGSKDWVPYTSRTHKSGQELYADLAECCDRGWSTDQQEFEEFANCVAVPICRDSEPVGAISITSLIASASISDLLSHLGILQKAAQNVAAGL